MSAPAAWRNYEIPTLPDWQDAFAKLTPKTVRSGPLGWLEAAIGGTETAVAAGGFLSLAPSGGAAAVFGNRSSDAISSGYQSFALGSFTLNDNTTRTGTTYGHYIEARRSAGAGTTQGIEVGMLNFGAAVTPTPFDVGAPGSGSTLGYWAVSGRGDVASNDCTAAFGVIGNGAKWRAGLVFGLDSIAGIANVGSPAIAMSPGYACVWYSSADQTPTAFIRSDAGVSGAGGRASIIFTDAGVDIGARNGVTALSVANGLNLMQPSKVVGTFEATGNALFDGGVSVAGAVAFGGTVNGTSAVFTADVGVANILSAGQIVVATNAGVAGTMSAGAVTVNTTLAVTGATTIGGVLNGVGASFSGSVGVSTTLNVGNMNCFGNAGIAGTLNGAAATFSGNVGVAGTMSAGAATVNTTLGVNGTLTAGAAFAAVGNSTLGGALAVVGNSTLGGNLNVVGNTTHGGTTILNGKTTLGATINVPFGVMSAAATDSAAATAGVALGDVYIQATTGALTIRRS